MAPRHQRYNRAARCALRDYGHSFSLEDEAQIENGVVVMFGEANSTTQKLAHKYGLDIEFLLGREVRAGARQQWASLIGIMRLSGSPDDLRRFFEKENDDPYVRYVPLSESQFQSMQRVHGLAREFSYDELFTMPSYDQPGYDEFLEKSATEAQVGERPVANKSRVVVTTWEKDGERITSRYSEGVNSLRTYWEGWITGEEGGWRGQAQQSISIVNGEPRRTISWRRNSIKELDQMVLNAGYTQVARRFEE